MGNSKGHRTLTRSNAPSLTLVDRLLCNKIEQGGLRDYFEITESYIRGPNESLALFRGLQNHTVASVKSLEDLDAAWIEEAQTISQKSLDLLIPTIRAEGSEIWAGWNPENETDPIEFLRHDPPPEALVIELNWGDNLWFPDVLKTDMLRDYARDPDKAAWIWGGQYMQASEARVFRNYRSGVVAIPDNVVWFYGVDWGFSVRAAPGFLGHRFVRKEIEMDQPREDPQMNGQDGAAAVDEPVVRVGGRRPSTLSTGCAPSAAAAPRRRGCWRRWRGRC